MAAPRISPKGATVLTIRRACPRRLRSLARILVPGIVAALGLLACTRTLSLQGRSRTRLSLDLRYPVTGARRDFASVCEGAHALLVSIATSGGTSGFDWRFLLGTDGRLYGCGNAGPDALACAEPDVIRDELPPPTRVMVEGISLAPADYRAQSASLDVLCRGIADADLGTGALHLAAIPGEAGVVLGATVPMLRVGDVNGTFADTSPSAREGAAARLTDGSGARTPGGGVIVYGGGRDDATSAAVAEVWSFAPDRIAFSPVAPLSAPRYALSATSVEDASNARAVLFAGGLVAENQPSAAADLWTPFGVTAVPMLAARAHAAAVPLLASPFGPAVVAMLGGDASSGGDLARDDYEMFYASIPASTANCSAPAGAPGFCAPNAAAPGGTTAEGHARACAIPVDASRVWLAGGYSGAQTVGMAAWIFDATGGGSFAAAAPVPQALRDAASTAGSEGGGARGCFGGFHAGDAAPAARDAWVRYSAGTAAEPPSRLRVARAQFSATTLLDGRILLAGGRNDAAPSGLRSLELFTPAAVGATDGIFAFATEPGGSCATGDEGGCVRMASPRDGHAAVRIDGTATWINGAVVLAGGAPAAEIYVPAYRCAGTLPVLPTDDAPVNGADYCERGRALQLLTDPASPHPFAF